MNKKLIAVAVAGVLAAPAVMADNSVTIYGVADVGLEQVEAKGATAGAASDVAGKSRVTSNSSYIGFKGQEELRARAETFYVKPAARNPLRRPESHLANRTSYRH